MSENSLLSYLKRLFSVSSACKSEISSFGKHMDTGCGGDGMGWGGVVDSMLTLHTQLPLKTETDTPWGSGRWWTEVGKSRCGRATVTRRARTNGSGEDKKLWQTIRTWLRPGDQPTHLLISSHPFGHYATGFVAVFPSAFVCVCESHKSPSALRNERAGGRGKGWNGHGVRSWSSGGCGRRFRFRRMGVGQHGRTVAIAVGRLDILSFVSRSPFMMISFSFPFCSYLFLPLWLLAPSVPSPRVPRRMPLPHALPRPAGIFLWNFVRHFAVFIYGMQLLAGVVVAADARPLRPLNWAPHPPLVHTLHRAPPATRLWLRLSLWYVCYPFAFIHFEHFACHNNSHVHYAPALSKIYNPNA